MDIKTILNKIEECKKETQRKELIKNFINNITYPKNKKIYDQMLKINYSKTLDNLYKKKELNSFLEILISIIQNLTPLSETYRKKYQTILLNLIIPVEIKDEEEALKKNLNYFVIATNNLEDIESIKQRKYLIYYLFFKIFIKIKLDLTIIELWLKLEKYMTKVQHEIIVYVLIIYSYINKIDDFPEQMIILKKIIEFCKFDFSNKAFFYENEDLTKKIVIMLLLYTPFKQEILINLYNLDPNYFMNIIQNIIIFFGKCLQDNNKYNIINNAYLININNFFEDDINTKDFDKNDYNNNQFIYNYFNKKQNFIKQFNKFIEKINLKEIFILNRIETFKGIIWTLSSILLKNYFTEKNKDISKENKNNSKKLFDSLILIFQYLDDSNKKIFIKQYLDLVKSLIQEVKILEEWSYILDILFKCSDIIMNEEQKKELIEKEFKLELNLLNEIFSIALKIYNEKKMIFCDMEKFSLLMHKCNQFLQNDQLMCFYIDIYLKNEHKNREYIIKSNSIDNNLYCNFINNLETLFFNVFSLPPKKFVDGKNYLLEIVHVNYLNDKNDIIINKDNNNSDISKKIIIERVLQKYLENIFVSSGDSEQNYTFFNDILSEILYETNNINFLIQILTSLIFIKNEKINTNLYNVFANSIILKLFENLINNPSKCILIKEKLSFLIELFFDENNMNDENIFKLGLTILKYFYINNDYEIVFIKNINTFVNSYYNDKHSILMADNLFNQNSVEGTNNSHHIVFPLVKIFNFINTNLEYYIKKIAIFENILEFYYLCFSKNFLILKNIELNLFFKSIFEEKELVKISSSRKITNYIIKILAYLPYQLNNNLVLNQFNNNESKLKENPILSDVTPLNIDPKYKISIINFLN